MPSSPASRGLAQEVGIFLLDDAGPWQIELCVDGADEVSATLDLIKAAAGRMRARDRLLCCPAQRDHRLRHQAEHAPGRKRKVPVEVLPFGAKTTAAALAELGRPQLREMDGTPFQTELLGQPHLRPRCGAAGRPGQPDRLLHALPGVVETGLFLGRADVPIVAGKGGVRTLTR